VHAAYHHLFSSGTAVMVTVHLHPSFCTSIHVRLKRRVLMHQHTAVNREANILTLCIITGKEKGSYSSNSFRVLCSLTGGSRGIISSSKHGGRDVFMCSNEILLVTVAKKCKLYFHYNSCCKNN
jgi:hypothetical protein